MSRKNINLEFFQRNQKIDIWRFSLLFLMLYIIFEYLVRWSSFAYFVQVYKNSCISRLKLSSAAIIIICIFLRNVKYHELGIYKITIVHLFLSYELRVKQKCFSCMPVE